MQKAPDGRLVWITRAEPGASATAARVAALGFTPVVSPLLRLQPVAAEIDLTDVAALAFTSANGVRAFAAAHEARDLPSYAVGEATAEAARAAGFAKVISADGDVAALARRIAADPPGGVVLHPAAAEPAGDLAADLAKAGIPVRSVTVYRSEEVEPTLALSCWESLSAVLLHSPRAARALETLIAARAAPQLRVLAISPAAAAPMAHLDLAGVAVAPLPNEHDLLSLLVGTIAI
jgi:uroporphyrinogen-III synthase